MAQEPQRLGLKFRDVLDALKSRGRDDEADGYQHTFLELFCPSFSEDAVLDMAFTDLCRAASIVKTMTHKTGVEARVSELKSLGYSVTPGERYVKPR